VDAASVAFRVLSWIASCQMLIKIAGRQCLTNWLASSPSASGDGKGVAMGLYRVHNTLSQTFSTNRLAQNNVCWRHRRCPPFAAGHRL